MMSQPFYLHTITQYTLITMNVLRSLTLKYGFDS